MGAKVAGVAWRIDEFVVRGEIDNRVRGRVTGRIWFSGREEPVELELAGNAWRDVAGRRLEFTNPSPKAGGMEGFASRQAGVIGDCTASRKVRVPEVSMDELMRRYEQRQPFPWHWGNSLYLEWFSKANGRVVIESAGYQLVVAPESTWEMTTEEEEQQRGTNAEAMGGFMERLGQAVADEQAGTSRSLPEGEEDPGEEGADADEPVDESGLPWKPLSEEEAEKMQEESDRLLDRIQARMAREGDAADFEAILEEEMEKRRKERGEEPPTPEEEAKREAWMEEMNRAAEEAAANPDPEGEELLDRKHPAAERAHALSLRLMREPRKRGWLPADAGEEHPLADLAGATMKAGAKLAGALNGEAWPPDIAFCANTIVRLKRARGYLDDALRAAEQCAKEKLGEAAWVVENQRELNALVHECDLLIGELRAKLERGCE